MIPLELLFASLAVSLVVGLVLGYLAAIKRVNEFELIICLAILVMAEIYMVWGLLFATLLPWVGLVIFGALVGCALTRMLVSRARV